MVTMATCICVAVTPTRCQNVYGCCEKRRMVDKYEMKPSQRIRPSSTQLADQRAQLSRHFCKLFSNRMSKSLIDTSTPRSFYASPASSHYRPFDQRKRSQSSNSTSRTAVHFATSTTTTKPPFINRRCRISASISADLLETNANQFVQTNRPFEPRILRNNSQQSKLIQSRNYQSASRRATIRIRSASVDDLHRSSLLQSIDSRQKLINRPSTMDKTLSYGNNDDHKYEEFVHEVTMDIINHKVYTDSIIGDIINKHINKSSSKQLNQFKLQHTLTGLLEQLGIRQRASSFFDKHVHKVAFNNRSQVGDNHKIMPQLIVKHDLSSDDDDRISLTDADIDDLINGTNIRQLILKSKISAKSSAITNRRSSSLSRSSSSTSSRTGSTSKSLSSDSASLIGDVRLATTRADSFSPLDMKDHDYDDDAIPTDPDGGHREHLDNDQSIVHESMDEEDISEHIDDQIDSGQHYYPALSPIDRHDDSSSIRDNDDDEGERRRISNENGDVNRSLRFVNQPQF